MNITKIKQACCVLALVFVVLLYPSNTTGEQQITIKYNPNGGTIPLGEQSLQVCTGTIVDYIPERTNYTFLGWAFSAEDTQPYYLPGDNFNNEDSENNVELFAVWEEPLDLGIINSPFSSSIDLPINGNSYYYAFSVSKEDYYALSFTFEDGISGYWYNTGRLISYNSSGTMYENYDYYFIDDKNPQSVWKLEAEKQYYLLCEAHWSANTTVNESINFAVSNVVIYDPGEGKIPVGMQDYQQLNDGKITISSYCPERSHYTFAGWAKKPSVTVPDFLPGDTFIGTETTTLYAIWNETYDLGCVNNCLNTELIFNIPDNQYYYEFSVLEDGCYEISMDTNLYGFWSNRIFLRRYVKTNDPITPEYIASSEYSFFRSYEIFNPNDVIRSATFELIANEVYTLNLQPHWNTSGELTQSLSIKKVLAVHYDVNGGSIPIDMLSHQKIETDGSVVIQDKTPERKLYTFIGWSKEHDSSTPTYLPGNMYQFDANTVLYAVWQEATNLGTINSPDVILPVFVFRNNNIYYTFKVPNDGNYIFEIEPKALLYSWRIRINLSRPANDGAYIISDDSFNSGDDYRTVWELEAQYLYTLRLSSTWDVNYDQSFSPRITIRNDNTFMNRPDLIIPARIHTIEEEAFNKVQAKYVYIPDGQQDITIKSKAFLNCPNLILVRIPANVISIASDSFNTKSITAFVQSGSYGESWAKNNGVQYVIENTQ